MGINLKGVKLSNLYSNNIDIVIAIAHLISQVDVELPNIAEQSTDKNGVISHGLVANEAQRVTLPGSIHHRLLVGINNNVDIVYPAVQINVESPNIAEQSAKNGIILHVLMGNQTQRATLPGSIHHRLLVGNNSNVDIVHPIPQVDVELPNIAEQSADINGVILHGLIGDEAQRATLPGSIYHRLLVGNNNNIGIVDIVYPILQVDVESPNIAEPSTDKNGVILHGLVANEAQRAILNLPGSIHHRLLVGNNNNIGIVDIVRPILQVDVESPNIVEQSADKNGIILHGLAAKEAQRATLNLPGSIHHRLLVGNNNNIGIVDIIHPMLQVDVESPNIAEQLTDINGIILHGLVAKEAQRATLNLPGSIHHRLLVGNNNNIGIVDIVHPILQVDVESPNIAGQLIDKNGIILHDLMTKEAQRAILNLHGSIHHRLLVGNNNNIGYISCQYAFIM
ncbi:hypothetical protein DCCM_0412 [Desulfocucumis palustris]|uniref:Uncharacterized protein n=1 Tax=Desulfocucumis palustris TaxID=1898651 RepID=A0A2L2XEG6_9FIRM|nr:hypothetical protein [Desulfocucumis palustris]GBF32221.1 hypothetical protein DCCM_0412 [Desulfocucumis palustris]